MITATWYGVVRFTKQRGANRVTDGKQDIERHAQEDAADAAEKDKIYAEMKNLLKLLEAQIKSRDKKIETLEGSVATLQGGEAKCRETVATLTEQNRWMRRALKKAGLISDEDDESYPRAKSDEINHPGAGEGGVR